jgi:hypothetical protein
VEDAAMPTRTDEGPSRQQDRDSDPSRRSNDELRNFETDGGAVSGDSDSGGAWTDDPDINTHGSER